MPAYSWAISPIILPLVIAWTAVAAAGPDPLSGIPIQPEHVGTPYHRVNWMPGGSWADTDGDCQDGRQEVLIAQSKTNPVLTADTCSVVSGRWVDPYSGETTTNPASVEIDHMVALKEVHDSGGASWPPAKKQAFAQGVTSENLFVVMTSTNRSKSDRDPGEWLPANKVHACWYVGKWTEVKRRWSLSMDRTEADAIRLLLKSCPAPN